MAYPAEDFFEEADWLPPSFKPYVFLGAWGLQARVHMRLAVSSTCWTGGRLPRC